MEAIRSCAQGEVLVTKAKQDTIPWTPPDRWERVERERRFGIVHLTRLPPSDRISVRLTMVRPDGPGPNSEHWIELNEGDAPPMRCRCFRVGWVCAKSLRRLLSDAPRSSRDARIAAQCVRTLLESRSREHEANGRAALFDEQ